MGTRNLTIIIKDNKIRLSQYGQWDGYFSYTGVKFLKFVRENLQGKSPTTHKDLMERFAEKVDLLKPCSDKYYENLMDKVLPFTEWDDNSDYIIPFTTLFPQFSRDTGVEILNVINRLHKFELAGKHFPIILENNESGMCEYANVINMDTDEIYMLTVHDFKGEPQTTCELLENFNLGMKCYYKEHIMCVLSIANCKKLVKELGL